MQAEKVLARYVALKTSGLRARFWAGFSLPLQAVRVFLGCPKLLLWAIIPALINVLLFVGAVVLWVTVGGWLLSWMWTRPEVVTGFDWVFWGLWWFAFALMGLIGAVLSYFLVLIVGGVLASPFNDLLSVRAEQALMGERVGATGARESDWVGSLVGSLRTVFSYVGVAGPLLGLNLIPGLGTVLYSALAGLLSSFLLVLDYSGPPLDRRGFLYREKVRLIFANKGFSVGFGAGTGLLGLVPVLNLVSMPILVVSGTIAGLSLHSWAPEAKQLEAAKRLVAADLVGSEVVELEAVEVEVVGQD